MSTPQGAHRTATNGEAWESVLHQYLGRLRFGVIQLTVRDGRVLQVACTERTRLVPLDRPSGEGSDRPEGLSA